MIPWTLGQALQDPDFPALSGARIVRIAVHPDLPRAGYGSRAVELLARFYQGQLADVDALAADGQEGSVDGGDAPAHPPDQNGDAGAPPSVGTADWRRLEV